MKNLKIFTPAEQLHKRKMTDLNGKNLNTLYASIGMIYYKNGYDEGTANALLGMHHQIA